LQVAKTSTWFYSGSHSLSVALSDGVTGNLMSKKMIKPGRDLLARVNQAFLDYGYSGLSMVVLARPNSRPGKMAATAVTHRTLRLRHALGRLIKFRVTVGGAAPGLHETGQLQQRRHRL